MAARMSYHRASPLVAGSSKDVLISTTPWEFWQTHLQEQHHEKYPCLL